MPDSRYIAKVHRRKTFWNNVTRVVIQLFVWTGVVISSGMQKNNEL